MNKKSGSKLHEDVAGKNQESQKPQPGRDVTASKDVVTQTDLPARSTVNWDEISKKASVRTSRCASSPRRSYSPGGGKPFGEFGWRSLRGPRRQPRLAKSRQFLRGKHAWRCLLVRSAVQRPENAWQSAAARSANPRGVPAPNSFLITRLMLKAAACTSNRLLMLSWPLTCSRPGACHRSRNNEQMSVRGTRRGEPAVASLDHREFVAGSRRPRPELRGPPRPCQLWRPRSGSEDIRPEVQFCRNLSALRYCDSPCR